IALAIVEVMLPRFNIFAGKELSLTFESGFLLAMLSLTVATGLLAGSYPALYISGFNPARVLKSHFTLPGGEQWARKSLVVFQFTVAIISMVFVWVLYAQMIFVQTKHLGYDRENVLYMNLEGRAASSLETFLSEVKTIPGVVEA